MKYASQHLRDVRYVVLSIVANLMQQLSHRSIGVSRGGRWWTSNRTLYLREIVIANALSRGSSLSHDATLGRTALLFNKFATATRASE